MKFFLKKMIKDVGEDVKKMEDSYIAGGNINDAATLEYNSVVS